MKVILTGVQKIDFEDENGKAIKGVKLHYTNVDENVIGRQASQKFIAQNTCDSLGVVAEELAAFFGSEIDVEFNGNRKVVGITV